MNTGSLLERLREAEGSGRVEFKRSCLWPLETDDIRMQGVLVRLANGNPETGGLVHLGREDDGTVVGLVNANGDPVTEPRQLRAAEQKLVRCAERIAPPMQIRWHTLLVDGKETVVVEVPGRPLGGWFQDERGVSTIGSGSHPIIARPDILQRWARELAPKPYELKVAPSVHGVIWVPEPGTSDSTTVLELDIRNLGSATSYVNRVQLIVDFAEQEETIAFFENPRLARMPIFNPQLPFSIEAGRHQSYSIRLSDLLESLIDYARHFRGMHAIGPESLAVRAVMVSDEIGHDYLAPLSEVSQTSIAQAWSELHTKQ